MQKERSMSLRPEDFGEETFGSKLKKKKSASKESKVALSKRPLPHFVLSLKVGETDFKSQFQSNGAVEVVSKDISKLSKAEKTELLLREAPELLAMLDQFKDSAVAMRDHILPLIEKVKAGNYPTDQVRSLSEIEVAYSFFVYAMISF